MAYFPTVGIIKAEHKAVADKVISAVTTSWAIDEQGTVFSAPLSPTGSEPATYFGVSNRASSYEEAQIILALLEGILPELPEGTEWGEDGFPTEAEAIAACAPANMSIESGAGEHTLTPQQRILATYNKYLALCDAAGVVPVVEEEEE